MITKIRADIKQSMIDKNVVRRDVLKMVLDKANALAKDKKIETPTNEMFIDAINKEKKQIQQTIDILKTNGKENSDLFAESNEKINILNEYLPKQLSEVELRNEIVKFVENNNLDTSNMGALMGKIMPVFKGKADGKLINQIVKSL